MNTNCRSAYGLKIPAGEENYATVSPIKNFSLCGKNAYTLSLAFYYTGNEDGDILTQDDSFKITFKDKHLRFYAQNFAEFGCELTEHKGGEHWFHTDKQHKFFKEWLNTRLS